MIIKNFFKNDELFIYACENFFSLRKKVLQEKNFFDVALSGGSTAQKFFSCMTKNFSQKNFSNVRFFFSDERAVSFQSDQSNAGNAIKNFFDPLKINSKNYFLFFNSELNLDENILAYENFLKNKLEKNILDTPTFDLIYLGIGTDGHTASIFPHSHLVKKIVQENNYSLLAHDSPSHLNEPRLTFCPQLINAAKNICVMASGQEKSQVIQKILKGPYEPEKYPSQLILRHEHEGLEILLGEMG